MKKSLSVLYIFVYKICCAYFFFHLFHQKKIKLPIIILLRPPPLCMFLFKILSTVELIVFYMEVQSVIKFVLK